MNALLRRLSISIVLVFIALAPVLAAELNLSDAAKAAETWVRLKGDTAGRVTYEWMNGVAYGVPEGAPSQTLFHIESVTVRQTRADGEGGFEERNFACRLYKDSATGAFIDQFVNPFTEQLVELGTNCNSGFPLRVSAAGMELLSDLDLESTGLGSPMTLQLIDAGDHVIVRRDAHSKFVVPNTGEVRREMSVDTFKLSAADLNNPELTSLTPAYNWISNTQWMSIFDMADTPGHMIWSINGRKYMDPQELPAEFRAALERAVPGALTRTIEWAD